MADVLIYGDTERSPEMRHEIPLLVPDPFLYAETGGRRHVVASAMECPRLAALDPELVTHPLEEFGLDELVASGATRHEIDLELAARACRSLAVSAASVPSAFPLEIADALRAAGVALEPQSSLFDRRRRVKSTAELAGIRRAQVAAEAGMRAAAALLRAAEPGEGGTLVVDGDPLTSERIKEAIRAAVAAAGASPGDDFIVSHGTQTAVGHEMGFGPIRAGEPVIIDLWPRDPAAACFADMTRTFVVGEVPDVIRRYHELTQESLEAARAAVRAGVASGEVHRISCEPYHRAGLPTQLNKVAGEALDHGFHHSLGHGVGLQVHEPPILGRSPDVLVAGDVVTLEPGCYDADAGGCRLEDLVVVTDDGCETLTDFPYGLEP